MDFWFLTILKLYLESQFPLLGGQFYKTFRFEASLYMFWFFFNFRGSFLSLSFGSWKFWNCILNQNSHFWGICFIKLLDLRPPYICFWFFGTLGGLFWVWFLVFEYFEIVFWIRIPTYGGLFYETFWFVHYFRGYRRINVGCKICDITEEDSLLYYIGWW